MLIVTTIAKICRYFFAEGKRIKQISRALRVSRNTVRAAMRSGTAIHRFKREDPPCPKIGDCKERPDALLERR